MITENHKDFIEKIKATKPKFKLMGLDVGQKKIGVAFASSDTLIATPFKTFIRKNNAFDLKMLSDLSNEFAADGIVIGLPLEANGEEGVAAKKIRSFSEKLSAALKLPITFEDERFTTIIAQDMLRNMDMSRKVRDNIDDQVSAQLILDGFIKKI